VRDEGVAEACAAVAQGRFLRDVGEEPAQAVCGEAGEARLQFADGIAVARDEGLAAVFVEEGFEGGFGAGEFVFEELVGVVLPPG
jgi:hypothetical protein